MKVLAIQDVKHKQPGESIMYRNRYGQYLSGRIMRKYLDDYGRLFFFVKRPDWRSEECLSLADFERGEYEMLD